MNLPQHLAIIMVKTIQELSQQYEQLNKLTNKHNYEKTFYTYGSTDGISCYLCTIHTYW